MAWILSLNGMSPLTLQTTEQLSIAVPSRQRQRRQQLHAHSVLSYSEVNASWDSLTEQRNSLLTKRSARK